MPMRQKAYPSRNTIAPTSGVNSPTIGFRCKPSSLLCSRYVAGK